MKERITVIANVTYDSDKQQYHADVTVRGHAGEELRRMIVSGHPAWAFDRITRAFTTRMQ